VTHVAAGTTRRTVYLSHADGTFTAAYSTNERVLGRTSAFTGPIVAAAPGSKDDGLLVVGPGLGYKGFEIDSPHPETSFGSLFEQVHYEGYARPSFLYQSTSGTDEAETKLSLTPLLYGTLKATFYAMLFALPLAVLAALYTSQFMHHRVRAFVKPGIEVMASLPSVVLGFLAALVIAPFVEDVVPSLLATLLAIPLVAFLVGVVWHGLPLDWKQGLSSFARLGIALVLVAGVAGACLALAGPLQRWFFSGPANEAGDFRLWLRGEPETGSGLPLLRAAFFVVGSSLGLFLLPRYGVRVVLERAPVAVDRVAKAFVYAILPGVALALLAGPAEALLFGGDFRRFLVGADGEVYDQRNSLVVGIAMGFAVIPIIYTIAEDALYAIPDALKSAALACGASPWQTAMRIVVPAAAPGIFSAVMIGLGRAVGETMIVLMATGGTPIIDPSPFNGFRTLSANIAIELPEAPEGGTLYRVLFLAGLLLFALTFVVNTVAEIVRLRFRRKFKLL
jgi:phosphate transport system permease protein